MNSQDFKNLLGQITSQAAVAHMTNKNKNDKPEAQVGETSEHRGTLIAIEGIDGTGKETQARMLRERIMATGATATIISFPQYGKSMGAGLVSSYLKGAMGGLNDLPPLLTALPYALDRLEALPLIEAALASHDVVILDRYVMSNQAHQAGKVACEDERTELLFQIDAIEYGLFNLPEPDLVIYLELPVEEATARVGAARNKDMHEGDVEYLKAVADTYDQILNGVPHMHVHRISPFKKDDEGKFTEDYANRFEVNGRVFKAASCQLNGHPMSGWILRVLSAGMGPDNDDDGNDGDDAPTPEPGPEPTMAAEEPKDGCEGQTGPECCGNQCHDEEAVKADESVLQEA